MSRTDFIDLLIIIGWTYINGYLFGWLLEPLGVDPNWTSSLFAFLGVVFGGWGIFERKQSGRFPPFVSILVWGVAFLCPLVALAWRLVDAVQRWLWMP